MVSPAVIVEGGRWEIFGRGSIPHWPFLLERSQWKKPHTLPAEITNCPTQIQAYALANSFSLREKAFFFTPTVCLPACLSVCLPACLPACLSVCLPACLSICLSVCLSVRLSVSLSQSRYKTYVVNWTQSTNSLSLSVCVSVCVSLSVCLCLSVCLYLSPAGYVNAVARLDLSRLSARL